MNERIKELLTQSGYDARYCSEDFNPEKFAELIIQDCIDLVNKRKDAAIDAEWLVDEAMSNAVWDIEENFGIEK